MIDFDKIKNLFVVYPPSCAGTHLGNLLSLHPAFNPKYNWDGNYEQRMIENYIHTHAHRKFHSPRSCNVHFDPLQKNINDFDKDDPWLNEMLSNDKKNVFTGHFTNFHNMFVNTFLRKYKPYAAMILTEPKVGSIAYIRNQLNGFEETNPYKNYQIPCKFPSPSPVDGLDFITEENGFLLDTDEFFTKDGFKLLNEKLQENLGITLDEKYEPIHHCWYEIATYHV
jgi:hypothetical protein